LISCFKLKLTPNRKYFKVAGPHLVEPSIQRTPFIFQAGASTAGKVFATKHAEAMFIPGLDFAEVKKNVDDIRVRAAEHGRAPNSIKLLVGMTLFVDETDEAAKAKYEEYLSYTDLEGSMSLFGGWTGADLAEFSDDEDFKFTKLGGIQSMVTSSTIPGSEGVKWKKARIAKELALGGPNPRAIGSATTVADLLQEWIDKTGIDGFNCSYAFAPADWQVTIKYLLPE
jgi:alkanesulfonate monooxygenase SsuD/methylene tetrahydromethanopterin reductase-like flavin-dependent oxidoreductase (luciferase family)